MLERFIRFLTESCRCSTDRLFLITVSGGIDSSVMSHMFHASGMRFSMAHCNFGLRGAESEADQHFVEKLALHYKVPCHIRQFETDAYARKHGVSTQMAARDLRYRWFEELAVENGYEYIATGHNKNDVVETMLLNFSRGTGIRGLMGIRSVNNNIIRPLLFASRKEILDYASEHKLKWRDDSSNQETKYHRNKIRHIIIPAFETLNPAFMDNALETINRLEHTGRLLDLVMEQVKADVWSEKAARVLINIEKLKKFPATDIILFELLKDYGISQLDQNALLHSLNSSSGKQFITSTHRITRDRKYLIISVHTESESSEVLIEKDTTQIHQPVQLSFTYQDYEHNSKIPAEKQLAYLDAEKLTYPIILRTWREGDRFRPLGLKGSKKISDFLINSKVPLPDKKHVLVLESGGKLVWVVNHRIDDRFKITEDTRKILIIEFRE